MTSFAELEAQKRDILDFVSGWPASHVSYRPAEGGWCATEVLDHVVRVEEEILAATRRGIASPTRIGLRDRVGVFLIDRLFQSQRRVGVPQSAAAVLPDPRADLPAVCTRWDATREELSAFLDALTPAQRRGGVFRHPVGGWMDVPKVLRFFWVHAGHHRFQLARLRESAAPR